MTFLQKVLAQRLELPPAPRHSRFRPGAPAQHPRVSSTEPSRAIAGPAGRSSLVYIGHQNALKDDLTAMEALRFLARTRAERPDDTTLTDALQRLGVRGSRHAPVRTLSQGQRRRVALARLALCLHVELWLLDEPFDALDADGIGALNGLLGEHAGRGGATLLTSHQSPSLREPVPRIFDLDRHGLA